MRDLLGYYEANFKGGLYDGKKLYFPEGCLPTGIIMAVVAGTAESKTTGYKLNWKQDAMKEVEYVSARN